MQYAQELYAKSDIKIFYKSPSSQAEGIKTFQELNNEVCKQDGKPIIRLYTTSTCPHCRWISSTYEKVVKEYIDKGKIVAYHWELDTKDDLLTTIKEAEIPMPEIELFQKYNQQYAVPEFLFGCKYLRIGNGYEAQNDLSSEEAEFRAVINKLLS